MAACSAPVSFAGCWKSARGMILSIWPNMLHDAFARAFGCGRGMGIRDLVLLIFSGGPQRHELF